MHVIYARYIRYITDRRTAHVPGHAGFAGACRGMPGHTGACQAYATVCLARHETISIFACKTLSICSCKASKQDLTNIVSVPKAAGRRPSEPKASDTDAAHGRLGHVGCG